MDTGTARGYAQGQMEFCARELEKSEQVYRTVEFVVFVLMATSVFWIPLVYSLIVK